MLSFAGFLLRRIVYAAIVVVGITFVVSAMIKLVPGDPVDVMAAGNPGMTDADKDVLRHQLGLDKSLLPAFGAYLAGAVHGDLGISFRQREPTTALILERLPATAELSFWALLFSIAVATPLGVITALRRDGIADYIGTMIAVLGVSIPGFLLGIVCILIFSVELHWLPSSGYRGSALLALGRSIATGSAEPFWNSFRYFLMPGASLAFALTAINARLTRSAMVEVLHQDFVLFARAKGVPGWVVVFHHALRNAIIPIVTVTGLQLGTLLSGAIIIETVFAWPGIGRLAVQSIEWRDYPLVQATVLVSAVLFVVLNLAVDVLYRLLDPRIQHA